MSDSISPGLWQLVDWNLIEATREFARWQAPGRIVEEDGAFFSVGSDPFPAGYANSALRTDPAIPAAEFLERARQFFAAFGRGFTIFVRGEQDKDLGEVAAASGLQQFSNQPWMICRQPLDEPRLPEGVTIRLASDEQGIRDALAVNREAYQSIGLPAEKADSLFANPRRLLTGRCTTYVAYLAERPVSTAMLISTEGVAGIYWVGTIADARGRGLADACTRLVTNIGFERGARVASLQSSPMGESVYRRIGYQTVDHLRWFLHPAPAD